MLASNEARMARSKVRIQVEEEMQPLANHCQLSFQKRGKITGDASDIRQFSAGEPRPRPAWAAGLTSPDDKRSMR